ncbi:hypothetical protein J4217_02875 [Candidatus Pacearchaeota archaeon]|nr:hypothetical protein [Candidatus Pacearchaeota archaeon]
MNETEKLEKPGWLKTKPVELEKTIIEFAKQGKTYSKIGIILRDQHGIPKSKLLGKRISEIVKENKITIKAEEERVKNKISGLNSHIEKHKHDKKAKKSLMKNSWIMHKEEVAKAIMQN